MRVWRGWGTNEEIIMKVCKYLLRAVQYFIHIFLLFAVILAGLVLLGLVDGRPEAMFRNGYDSIWQIALLFGAVSLFYPLFGYMKKEALAGGSEEELRPRLVDFMEDRGYRLREEKDGAMVFVSRSLMKRLGRVFADRITVWKVAAGFEFEGLRRDVVRLCLGFETRMACGEGQE